MLCLHNDWENTRDAGRLKAVLFKFEVAEMRMYKAPDGQHPPLIYPNTNLLQKTVFIHQHGLQIHNLCIVKTWSAGLRELKHLFKCDGRMQNSSVLRTGSAKTYILLSIFCHFLDWMLTSGTVCHTHTHTQIIPDKRPVVHRGARGITNAQHLSPKKKCSAINCRKNEFRICRTKRTSDPKSSYGSLFPARSLQSKQGCCGMTDWSIPQVSVKINGSQRSPFKARRPRCCCFDVDSE